MNSCNVCNVKSDKRNYYRCNNDLCNGKIYFCCLNYLNKFENIFLCNYCILKITNIKINATLLGNTTEEIFNEKIIDIADELHQYLIIDNYNKIVKYSEKIKELNINSYYINKIYGAYDDNECDDTKILNEFKNQLMANITINRP